MPRRPFPALAALLALPAAGAAAGDGPALSPRTPPAAAADGASAAAGGVTLSPRVARRQAESFAPAVPDAALAAPGDSSAPGDPSADPPADPFAEGSPSLPAPASRSTPAHAAPAPHSQGGIPHLDGGVTFAPAVTRDAYRRAYHAVPYSLAEHRANPSYRHEAAMKFLTGEYPPARPVVAGGAVAGGAGVAPGPGGFGPAAYGGYGGPGGGVGYGLGSFGVGLDRFGFGRGLGYGPAGIGGVSPAAFPGLLTGGGVAGPNVHGPPPFAFDRIQGAVPTFVNRYRPPGVYLPAR